MTGTNVLDVLRARGFVAQVSDEDALRRAFDNARVTLYQGFDPTASSLHTGHLVGIMALAHMQELGHRPIAVIGGGTGMIGGPPDRPPSRPLFALDGIRRNPARIRPHLSPHLGFSGPPALTG